MSPIIKHKPVPGNPFREVLALLMAHALGGAESEADPYVLPRLVREYIAWALALYYQCEHCNQHHKKVVIVCQAKEQGSTWAWEDAIAETVLFTRAERMRISHEEWHVWETQWGRFAKSLGKDHERVVTLILLAIGIARDDKELTGFGFRGIADLCEEKSKLQDMVRDVFRVVIAMKAATTEFRMESTIATLLQEFDAGT